MSMRQVVGGVAGRKWSPGGPGSLGQLMPPYLDVGRCSLLEICGGVDVSDVSVGVLYVLRAGPCVTAWSNR